MIETGFDWARAVKDARLTYDRVREIEIPEYLGGGVMSEEAEPSKLKPCKRCGYLFRCVHPNQRYCPRCREEVRKDYWKERERREDKR